MEPYDGNRSNVALPRRDSGASGHAGFNLDYSGHMSPLPAFVLRPRWPMAVLLGAAAVAGCANQAPGGTSRTSPRVAFSAPASSVGYLRLDGDSLLFAPCNGEATTVQDRPDGQGIALVHEFGSGDQGVLVMLSLDGRTVGDIRYASPEGPRCTALPPRGDIEARGNEPFWIVSADGPIARYQTPENMDGVIYVGGVWHAPAPDSWRFEASRSDLGTTESIALEVTETPCTDSMSGARFPYQATVTIGDRQMTGCALEGRNAVGP